ncbi:MAG TPA: cupin domain-containing protein [Anaerolineales bacterium]|nr:cupin domain-containing protein [Anaerolineales bacterium]
MSNQEPYSIHLDAKYGPLELVDLQALASAATDAWYNQTLCRVNDCVVRIGVVQGEFHWHKHDEEDEFFYVVSGHFIIDLEDRTVELAPQQGITVPKGVMHRPRAPERTVILMIEGAGVSPTGDKSA